MARMRMATLASLIALGAAALPAAKSTGTHLQRATQALMDARAPGERSVREHYTDPQLV